MLATTRDRLKIMLAAFLFSTGGAAVKATTLTGWQVACFRSGIAALAFFVLSREARRGWGWRPALVGVAYAGALVPFVVANKLTTSANAIFLQSTGPLYLLLLGPLLLREPVRRSDLVVTLAIAVGLVLVFTGTERPVATAPDPARGNLLAALSGLTWALTIAGLRWMGRSGGAGEGSGAAAVVIGNLFAMAICLPMAFPLAGSTTTDWAAVLYLGVFQIGVAYLLMTTALRTVPAFEASILLLVEPVFNPIWTWLVHGETPGSWALAGGAMILGATTLKTWIDARLTPQPT